MNAVQKTILIPYDKYLRLIGKTTEHTQSQPVDYKETVTVKSEPLREISETISDQAGDRKNWPKDLVSEKVTPVKEKALPVTILASNTSVIKKKKKKKSYPTKLDVKGPPGIPRKTQIKKRTFIVRTPAKTKWISL